MSGADDLEEAVALANGGRRPAATAAPGAGHRAAAGPGPDEEPREARETGDTEDEDGLPHWLTRRAPLAPVPPATAPRGAGWEAAREAARRAAGPGHPVTVPSAQALHRVLAAPLTALTDLPPFDTAAMDGWAVAGPGPWTADGDGAAAVLAGHAAGAPLPDGHAVRIATGARVPAGATAVVRSEHCREPGAGGRLRLAPGAPQHAAGHGTDVRPRGQECRSGDVLLPAGTRVTPAVLGLAAAAGYDELTVVPAPRAEVLVLGDELLTEGRPRDGLVRDALGPMLGPWLTALGARVTAVRRLGDDAKALRRALSRSTADLLVTTGGTAHGPVDHLRPALERAGARLLVDGAAVRPGHPMLLAALDGGRHVVGLPGNPLAAVSGLLTLAAPLVRALGGHPVPAPVREVLTEEVRGHPRDTRLVPVARSARGASPLRYCGPAMLRGIASADALAVVPPGGLPAGRNAELLELPW
jgi:molybdopterin molybdotransferase